MAGRSKVTVRFEAAPVSEVAAVFGLRVIRADADADQRRGFPGSGRSPGLSGLAQSGNPRYHRYMSEPLVPQKSPIVKKMEPGTYYWCSCGRSANQPFCDGSHGETGFAPLAVEIPQARTVAWCACKHTKTPPFCDGSHAHLK